MARKRWSDLSPKTKGLVIGAAAVDAALRTWALRDLAGRSKDEVNGSKTLWSAGMGLVNSVGILPLIYLVKGRKTRSADAAPEVTS